MSALAVSAIAQRELKKNLSNLWLPLVAGLLLIVNLGVTRIGFAFAEPESSVDSRALLLSLIHLQMYAVPLFAFVLSYAGVLAEREQGTLDLLLSYPIVYRDLILGKWLGFCSVLGIAITVGIAAAAIPMIGGGISIGALLAFLLLSLLLGFSCVSLGLALSCIARDRTVAIAACVVLWVFFVFVFDLIFVFIQVVTEGSLPDAAVQALLLLNPAEAFRIAAISSLLPADAAEIFGLGTGVLSIPFSLLALAIWTAAPVGLAMVARRRLLRGES
ncbi:MAG: ABC transporter permease subunit [Deltaproteobacteria bacterium]|nr:ABC transporter permease subunit [Deltaproteobacteria bacterium]MBW2691081.1 ABC transporter permease subunit [Deltaproteobacteria bacterium]